MKKIILKSIILIFVFSIINVNAKNAHNIYSNPQINTREKYDTFMIDFQGTKTPSYTYWALCNWQMDLTTFKQYHNNVEGGGAYAGLQATDNNKRVAIMSFWEVSYDNGTIQRAKMIYPSGETKSFGGEGEGSHNVTEYPWKTNNWYRMVLHAWDNPSTNTTYMAQWFQDLSTNKWTLITVFDTKLPSSAMTGGLSLFQENYVESTSDEIRELNFKNMYARKKSSKAWISINKTELTYDTKAFGFNTKGRHEFGVRNNMFYGLSGGNVANQDDYDSNLPESQILSINQPNTPPITPTKVNVNVNEANGKTTISWDYNAPQIEYKINIYDKENNLVNTLSEINPATRTITIDDNAKIHIYQIEVKDIYGNTSRIKSSPKDYIIDGDKLEDIQEENAAKEEQEEIKEANNNNKSTKVQKDKRNEYTKIKANNKTKEKLSIGYIVSYIIIAISLSIIIVSITYIVNNKKKKKNNE